MDQRLAPALRELRRLLLETGNQLQITLRFALLGGLAVSTWGVIRATQDIDIMADCDPSPIRDLALRAKMKQCLDENGCSIEWRVGDYDDPIPLLLRVKLSPAFRSVGVDILWAHKQWQREALLRAIAVDAEGTEIPVLHPEDLILMKLAAGGPQDLLDVKELLTVGQLHVDLDRLQKSARRLRLGKSLEKCMREISVKK
jgi:predicted nucleotidyltransferase